MKTSLIITVFNRNKLLRKSLIRMTKMTLPDELVIVDDGSSDGVRDTCLEIKKLQPNLKIVYLYHNNPTWDSCSIPKNIGAQNASNEILIFAEPEVMFITDVIKQMKEIFNNRKDCIVTAGQIYFGKDNGPEMPEDCLDNPLKFIQDFGSNEWLVGTVDLHGGQPTYTFAKNLDATWVLGVLKESVLEINGWDEDMSSSKGGGGWGFDDTDALTRLRIKGYGQYKDPEMIVLHQFHIRPPQWIMDSWPKNEILMKAKNFNGNEYKDNPKLRANDNRPFGILNGTKEIL